METPRIYGNVIQYEYELSISITQINKIKQINRKIIQIYSLLKLSQCSKHIQSSQSHCHFCCWIKIPSKT
jgi:hypothetical protein